MDLVFLGTCVAFSKRILRVVEQEFAGLDVRRFDSVDAMASTASAGGRPARLLILDEALGADLLARRQAYRDAAGSADLVFAYRRPEAAQELLDAGQNRPCYRTIKLLPMNRQLDTWLSVLRLLLHGETYVPPELLPATEPAVVAAVVPSRQPVSPADGVLTQRELDVVELVARGQSNKAIAAELKLSEHTVKLHLHNIITKLGVYNRTGAARWYISQGVPAAEPLQLLS